MTSLTISTPCDWHVHLRQGETLKTVAPETARLFGMCMVMPNTTPPVRDIDSLFAYGRECGNALRQTPLRAVFAIRLDDRTTPELVTECKKLDWAVAFKLYPDGVTTNSHGTGLTTDVLWNALTDRRSRLYEVLVAMAECRMVLSIHAEAAGLPYLQSELAFLPWIANVMEKFPKLRVVIEHISTVEAARMIRADTTGRLAATVTAHHLLLSCDDVFGKPDHYCKPVCNTNEHRSAIRELVFSGCENVFFGSDSAPHPRSRKTPSCCAAGVFSAPVATETIVGQFVEVGETARLNDFLSRNGCRFYGVQPPTGSVTFIDQPFRIVEASTHPDGFASFLSGQKITWRAADRPASQWHREIE